MIGAVIEELNHSSQSIFMEIIKRNEEMLISFPSFEKIATHLPLLFQ